MIVGEALQKARRKLRAVGIQDADLEAEVILRHVLCVDRAAFYASLIEHMSAGEEESFSHLLERRLTREPLAYILGKKEFYGLTFKVNRDVLIPRQETELLVEKAMEFARSRGEACALSIADVGTGSGAIAIALACHLPWAKIYATDVSSKALGTARENCRRYGVEHKTHFLVGDILNPLTEPVDLIVTNLPYVRSENLSKMDPELLFEPREALDGGLDGLDVIRRLISQAPGYLRSSGGLILELDPPQVEAVKGLAWKAFPGADISVVKDLSDLDRVVMVNLGKR
ncbi:MAG: peptide chain release factor N(5)-glutamine methyltransferase [Chloroflexi bacterium]|nr:peptide chain release factor N(5)-glutamine methyltransferase [Chloroflexota bacterium]